MSDFISSISTGEIVHGLSAAQAKYPASEHKSAINASR
jgi:hypothetical protein